ncbi:hypothetical protein PsYK624_137940 [Phanerochaete sordida]|uniref:Heterokaryon incompatibility domain-containing protein n=1 Tax=Phanerochaete sordida TaxID=48140 RepID=A0A9P3LJP3_9APHY|nr:hypothetical protein PsYK624_137940 [Phanerochaete sordida]
MSRIYLWGVIKMATSGTVPVERLFISQSVRPGGDSYTLEPKPRSSIPFQWIHVSSHAIPDSLADMPCAAMTCEELLGALNKSLDGRYSHLSQWPGLQECLQYCIDNSMDFGQAYGYLRTVGYAAFEPVLARLNGTSRLEDEAMRQDAMRGGYIRNAHMLPRRVWDLYSNRVLPSYALFYSLDSMAHVLRTVSHSWVRNEDSQLVWTPINGKQWPVPIPLGTSLDHIRVELLNHGVEYVWLDVLCLRQRRRREDEATRVEGRDLEKALIAKEWERDEKLREEEWKLDVPTIGSIYRIGRSCTSCITYFNGLGLPFDPSPPTLASDRHWTKRVWTVQEATTLWLPGGMTDLAPDEARAARDFFQVRFPQAIPDGLGIKISTIEPRHSSTELDKVHSVAYLLRCPTLPIYEVGMHQDQAWTILLKHLHPTIRAKVALEYLKHFPDSPFLLPSWAEFMQFTSSQFDPDHPRLGGSSEGYSPLDMARETDLAGLEPGTFVQLIKHVGTVSMASIGQDGMCSPLFVPFMEESVAADTPTDSSSYPIRGYYREDKEYMVLELHHKGWLVVERVGQVEVDGMMRSAVVKRGHILSPAWLGFRASPREVEVVYVTEDEALTMSSYRTV